MRELDPACPPGTFDSRTSTLSPSDAPYTAAASPAGPAPTTTRSFTRVWSTVSLKPRQSAIRAFVGFRNTVSTPQISTGTSAAPRSEEHTSELQSHVNLVCRLLLEK